MRFRPVHVTTADHLLLIAVAEKTNFHPLLLLTRAASSGSASSRDLLTRRERWPRSISARDRCSVDTAGYASHRSRPAAAGPTLARRTPFRAGVGQRCGRAGR